MLYQLSIRNVAIIESVELSFEPGLNILTGETGAGKSILIDSLNLVLGARTNRELIRKPAQRARVEAAFDDIGPRAEALLNQWELASEDGSLIISREIFENGRSTARINGNLATLTQVKELASLLVDVHGQHEYRYLLDPAQHPHILDAFAGEPATRLLSQLAAVSARYSEASGALAQRFGDEQERQRRMDILQYQIHEISEANLILGEDEQLESERNLMQHAERLKQAVEGAYRLLYEGTENATGEGPGAQWLVDQSVNLLERAGDIDPSLGELTAQLTSISYELEDAIETLRSASERFDFDDFRLEEVENRLAQLKQLKRKYGATLEEVLEFGRQAEREYDQYLHAEENVIALEAEMHDLSVRWAQLSGRLTQVRADAAKRFEQAVMDQLKDLGMEDAKFQVRLIPRPQEEGQRSLPAWGAERVQFYLAANRGEEPGPLDKVASGGELSRIMLALKAVVAAMDDVPTMIFDEIDSGISGNMARIVAQKLALIGRQRQVICITHTAQIAAMADAHYFIEKVTDENRTRTQVSALAPEDRYREIARLVGGDMAGSVAAEHAREMLKWCRQYKKSLS